MTLFDFAVAGLVSQRNKHELGADYVEDTINQESNYELLTRISEALEDRLEKFKRDNES